MGEGLLRRGAENAEHRIGVRHHLLLDRFRTMGRKLIDKILAYLILSLFRTFFSIEVMVHDEVAVLRTRNDLIL